MMDDYLIEKLRAAIDADERWALACNLPYQYAADDARAPATGVHWTWITGENWIPVVPDPVTMEAVEGPDGSTRVNLATTETWTSHVCYAGRNETLHMPRTYSDEIEGMDPAAAGHIIRHDPARVLAAVKAHRDILAVAETLGIEGSTATKVAMRTVVAMLAKGYGITPEGGAARMAEIVEELDLPY